MWQLVLLANLEYGKPSAAQMVHGTQCQCPTYLLSEGAVLNIKQDLKNHLKVSLVLIDSVTQKRYEGEIDRILSKVDNKHKTRWDIIGKGIYPVAFKDENNISYTGVKFWPINNSVQNV
jgi:hypothetical protein